MKDFFGRIPKRLLIAVSGLLLGLTVIYARLGILAYIALIPLGIALFGKLNSGEYKKRTAYLDGFIFYMCLDLVCFHWFVYFYPLEFAGFNDAESVWIIVLAWVGLSLLQSVFSAFVFVFLAALSKTQIYKRNPILMPFFVSALLCVNEWTQTFTWAGVPWSRIAISQTEMPIFMQSASLFGSYFVSFIVVLVGMLLAYALMNTDKRRFAAICALGLFLGNALFGTVAYFVPLSDGDEIVFAAVQGNFPSQTNYGATAVETYERYEKLTREAAEAGADVIIWPEGTFRIDPNSNFIYDGKLLTLGERVSSLAQESGATVVIGSYTFSKENKLLNSMSVYYENGERIDGAYSKMKRVPFGEYVPMRDLITTLLPILDEINVLGTDVHRGDGYKTYPAFAEEGAAQIGTLICFDSIYEETALSMVREGAELLIVPSNDSWFYDSRALNMHHSQNILRAVETGRYTVNCGNTGLTSIVTDKGDIAVQIAIFEEGFALGEVRASDHRTLYSYVGNLFVYICIAFVITPLIYEAAVKIKTKKSIDL
ncbi:MAG: apolipoprotein N-acyltransferase [Clostridia bacterium]|nr:apolipoprotein N-acyltransferase [Clostridia bacterium]